MIAQSSCSTSTRFEQQNRQFIARDKFKWCRVLSGCFSVTSFPSEHAQFCNKRRRSDNKLGEEMGVVSVANGRVNGR